MKKLRILVMALVSAVMLISCGESSSSEVKIDANNAANKVAENSVEQKKTLNGQELNDELNNQPVIITETQYCEGDPELEYLYPDGLNVVVKNNSGTDVKNVVVGLVAWDENNFPVKIKPEYGEGAYFVTGNYSDANMINGATFGEGLQFNLDPEGSKIAKFKAIVASYDDFDGNTWVNPLLADFKELYVDKKLVE